MAALTAYLAASAVAEPVAGMLLRARAKRGKEDLDRLPERLGHPGVARPEGQLAWLHGASVGEALSMLPLIAALKRGAPRLKVLATTGTVTSARQMAHALPPETPHQFAPLDTRPAVRRFLGHWQPDLAIWIESEFWPRLMIETARRRIPMALVNARMSARSAAGWRRLPTMARSLLRLFQRIEAQDAETVARLTALGARSINLSGNLKVAADLLGADESLLATYRAALSSRPVFLAASTHAPEEEVIIAAHRRARSALPGLLTILAPRHPERGPGLAAELRSKDFAVCPRWEMPAPDTDIWLADTLGELGLWFRLAPVAFVGGSLSGRGGHNPFEPAALECAILHGPSTENFGPAYAALKRRGAAHQIGDAEEIAAVLPHLIGSEGGPTPSTAQMTAAASKLRDTQTPDIHRMAAGLLSLLPAEPGSVAR
ncbi:MAG: 3-deoxy-D-manno-octulosonic acid transferase [Pseudomonadota bacterium]